VGYLDLLENSQILEDGCSTDLTGPGVGAAFEDTPLSTIRSSARRTNE
jgi:hypothetical protein